MIIPVLATPAPIVSTTIVAEPTQSQVLTDADETANRHFRADRGTVAHVSWDMVLEVAPNKIEMDK